MSSPSMRGVQQSKRPTTFANLMSMTCASSTTYHHDSVGLVTVRAPEARVLSNHVFDC